MVENLKETERDEFAFDRPVSDAAGDVLSRMPFARRLARVIENLPEGASLVAGLHGPWGDGKSSVLNLLRNELQVSNRVIVRDFNPWRLSEEDALLRGFFGVLQDAIGASVEHKLEKLKKWGLRAGRWLRFISRPVSLFWKPAETVDQLIEKFIEGIESGKTADLEEVRRRLAAKLEQSKTLIVVLIDDIDRLDLDEAHRMFRLIKACADLPSVVFILAFDDKAVASLLGGRFGGDSWSGRAFLEKIVQLPLKLPRAAKEDLRALCLDGLQRALDSAKVSIDDEEVGRFVSAFDAGPGIVLSTARMAKSYGNGVMFALPMLRGEVNHVDLLLIESVRTFFPDAYQAIQASHEAFSGTSQAGSSDAEGCKEILDPVLAKMSIGHQEAAKSILMALFPRVESAYSNVGYGSDSSAKWAAAKRICSPDYTRRYFTYSVDKRDVADAAIDSLLQSASAGNSEQVNAWLSANLSGATAGRVIQKLRDREDHIAPAAVEHLISAIASQAGILPNQAGVISASTVFGQAAILISKLSFRLDAGDRVALLRDLMRRVEPIRFGVEVLRWLRVTDDPQKEEKNAVSEDDLKRIRSDLVLRIKEKAGDMSILFDPKVVNDDDQLYEWWRAEGTLPVQEYLLGMFAAQPRLISVFLQSQAPLAWTVDASRPHYAEFRGDHLKNISLVIDLDTLASLVESHCEGNFSNPSRFHDDRVPLDQRIAESFIYTYRAWKSSDGAAVDAGVDEDLDDS